MKKLLKNILECSIQQVTNELNLKKQGVFIIPMTFLLHLLYVLIHVSHDLGLYEKIKNVNNPEDIAKWIEDRKKNYPSKENVEKRYERQEELIKKGIRIQKNDNKFGRDKYRCKLHFQLFKGLQGKTNFSAALFQVYGFQK